MDDSAFSIVHVIPATQGLVMAPDDLCGLSLDGHGHVFGVNPFPIKFEYVLPKKL